MHALLRITITLVSWRWPYRARGCLPSQHTFVCSPVTASLATDRTKVFCSAAEGTVYHCHLCTSLGRPAHMHQLCMSEISKECSTELKVKFSFILASPEFPYGCCLRGHGLCLQKSQTSGGTGISAQDCPWLSLLPMIGKAWETKAEGQKKYANHFNLHHLPRLPDFPGT